jgi:hypothetical protein
MTRAINLKIMYPHTDIPFVPSGSERSFRDLFMTRSPVFTLLKCNSIFIASLMIESMHNATISHRQLALSDLP